MWVWVTFVYLAPAAAVTIRTLSPQRRAWNAEVCMNAATAARQPYPARPSAAIAAYWALTKPEINFLIAIVTFAGFYLGLPAELHRLPVPAADSHPPGYAARIERRECSESIYRAAL